MAQSARHGEICRGVTEPLDSSSQGRCSGFIHAVGGTGEDVSLRRSLAGGQQPCDSDVGRLKTGAMAPLLFTCLLVFCGVSSGQRQDSVDIVKLCRLAADGSHANPLHQKLHAKTHNEILVGTVWPQRNSDGENSAAHKQLLRQASCRENATRPNDGGHHLQTEIGNDGGHHLQTEICNVSSREYPVISPSERTLPNIDDVAGFGSQNEGTTPMDLLVGPPSGLTGRTRTHRVLGPLHDPLWFIEPDTLLPTRPPMHWSESAEGAYLWSIALLGGVTNAVVVATCACSRRVLRPLHVLVAALAVADLLVACVYVPTYTYLLVDVPASLVTDADRRVCRVARAVFVLAAGASLSIKDLIAIYFRLMVGSRRWRHRIFRHTPVLALLAWLVNAAVIFAPCYAGFPHVDLYPNALLCAEPANGTEERWRAHAQQAYYPTAVLLYYFVVLSVHLLQIGITFVCFVEVHVAILSGRRMCKLQRYTAERKRTMRRYRRASRVTGFVFASSVVCWLPLYVVCVVDPAYTHLPAAVHRAVIDLFLLKSALHPLLYMTGLRSLRHEMKLLCTCRCRDRKVTSTQFLVARTSDLTGVYDSYDTARLLADRGRAV